MQKEVDCVMRRFACMVALALLLSAAVAPAKAAPDAASRLYPYGNNRGYGLQDASGKLVTESIFNNIPYKLSWSGAARYIAAIGDNKTVLLDENGKPLCEPTFSEIFEMPGTRTLLALYAATKSYAVIDENGKTLFELSDEYQHYQPGLEGQFIAYDGKNYFLVDKTGETISRGYSEIWLMREGATAYTCANGSVKKRGVLSLKGEVVVPCEYIIACQRNGYTIVAKHGEGVGLIDESGEYVIEPECSDIDFVTYNGEDHLQLSYRVENEQNEGEYYTVTSVYEWDLRKFTEFPFDSVYVRENHYAEETVVVSRSFVRNSQGSPIINSETAKFDPNNWIETPLDENGFGLPFFGKEVAPLGDGYFFVWHETDGACSIVNNEGKVMASYFQMELATRGYVSYREKENGPWGLIKNDGTVVVEPRYTNMGSIFAGGESILQGYASTHIDILLPPDATPLEMYNYLDYLLD